MKRKSVYTQPTKLTHTILHYAKIIKNFAQHLFFIFLNFMPPSEVSACLFLAFFGVEFFFYCLMEIFFTHLNI